MVLTITQCLTVIIPFWKTFSTEIFNQADAPGLGSGPQTVWGNPEVSGRFNNQCDERYSRAGRLVMIDLVSFVSRDIDANNLSNHRISHHVLYISIQFYSITPSSDLPVVDQLEVQNFESTRIQGGPGPLFRDPRWGRGGQARRAKIFCIFTYNAYFLTWVALL